MLRQGLNHRRWLQSGQTGIDQLRGCSCARDRSASVRVERAERIGTTRGGETMKGGPHVRPEERVVHPPFRRIEVNIRRHHVVVARQHHGLFAGQQLGRVGRQAVEPAQLVIELRKTIRVGAAGIRGNRRRCGSSAKMSRMETMQLSSRPKDSTSGRSQIRT